MVVKCLNQRGEGFLSQTKVCFLRMHGKGSAEELPYLPGDWVLVTW